MTLLFTVELIKQRDDYFTIYYTDRMSGYSMDSSGYSYNFGWYMDGNNFEQRQTHEWIMNMIGRAGYNPACAPAVYKEIDWHCKMMNAEGRKTKTVTIYAEQVGALPLR